MARASVPRTGSRSSSRASTSRSWKARRPSARRSRAAATVALPSRTAMRHRQPSTAAWRAARHCSATAATRSRRGPRSFSHALPFQFGLVPRLPTLTAATRARTRSCRAGRAGLSERPPVVLQVGEDHRQAIVRAGVDSRAGQLEQLHDQLGDVEPRQALDGLAGDMLGDEIPALLEGQRHIARARRPVGSSSRMARASSSPGSRRRRSSSSSSSTKAAHRSSKASCEVTSSATSTRGGRPASRGCSVSSRCAKACSVHTGRAVELVESCPGQRGGWPALQRRLLERVPHPVAQLGGGLVGEGDGGDHAHRHAGFGDQRLDALDERPRLAETAPASTKSVEPSSELMRRRSESSGAAQPSPSSSEASGASVAPVPSRPSRRTYDASSGAATSCSQRRRRSVVPKSSGSHTAQAT